MRAGVLAALVLAGCVHGPSRPLSIPQDLQADVGRIRENAARLVAFERLSSAAARSLYKVRLVKDPPVLGMVAVRTSWAEAGSVVFLVARPEGGVQVLYEARVIDRMGALAAFRRLDEPRPLVGEEEEVWRARQTVLAQFAGGRSCGAELDILVLPREAPDVSFDVFPMPAPRVKWAVSQVLVVRNGHAEFSRDGTMELVVAGQERFRVSADGRTVLEHRRVSGECQVRSLDHVNGGSEYIDVTDLAADLPNEAQLLDSAVLGWNFRIVTRRGVWEVARGDLSFVGTR